MVKIYQNNTYPKNWYYFYWYDFVVIAASC